MKKLNIRIILLQFFGMIFFINGILQLRLYSVSEKIICLKNHFPNQKLECCTQLFPKKEDVLSFWPGVYIWIFFALLIGVFLIAYFNWKNKLSPLNTIIITILFYILLRLKFFRREIVSHLFRPIRTLLFNDLGAQYLFEGIVFTTIGFVILSLSIKTNLFSSKKSLV